MVNLQHAVGNNAVQQLLHPAAPDPSSAHEESEAKRIAESATHSAFSGAVQTAVVAPVPAVDSALGSGRLLDPVVEAEMSHRLGANFAYIRIHDDAAASASARAQRALAYTLGNHIVFGAGRFAPNAGVGRTLLAHELVHTLQQTRRGPPRIQRQNDPNTIDVDIEPVSPAEAQRLQAGGMNLPTTSAATASALGASPYATLYPDYKQQGDSCGAASLVTALLIWDREHWDPAHPNSRLVDACDLVIASLERHGAAAAQRWATGHPLAPCQGDATCNLNAWTAQSTSFMSTLAHSRDTARAPGGQVPEGDFQQIGLALYFLWNQGRSSGLGSSEIFQIQRSLGLSNIGPSTSIPDFDSIFTNSIITGLNNDEMAQVFWFTVPSRQQHAFILGRLSSSRWFLADQGPGVHFEADTVADLHTIVRTACTAGSYWLYTGSTQQYIDRTHILPGYVGVQKLAGPQGTQQETSHIIAAGTTLGQVDAGYFTIGDDLTTGSYVGREYTLPTAQAMLPGGSGGGVIVEMPAGVFSVYTTSAVSDANLDQTSLDASDSSSMLLGGVHTFHHAWLILGNRWGVRRGWFRVY